MLASFFTPLFILSFALLPPSKHFSRIEKIAMKLLLVLALLIAFVYCSENEIHRREKRNYYGGYDMYGGDDFWYVGRIIGMIIGIIVLLFCCCLPCICIVGIWFAGWFGLRQRNAAKKTTGQANTPSQIVSSSSIPPVPIPFSSQPQQSTQIPYDTPGNANYIVPPTRSSRYPIIVDSSPSDVTRVAMPDGQVVYSAEDRYYTSSTAAPAPVHRSSEPAYTSRY
ncbi:unnamed protein product [Caenorhabditis angaria]|uniref:Uncharacterized protein n=1 Tax=Caenorhabditis angaria TaxID=860376 RepID=A0A9P1I662_9PELO|nr:unnamed protein product [Caenorhabditis angaria]